MAKEDFDTYDNPATTIGWDAPAQTGDASSDADGEEGSQSEGAHCEPGSDSLLCLPRETDERSMQLRWWRSKKGRWTSSSEHEFVLDPAVVLDHELREVGHDYWSDGPDRCPSLAAPDAGVCPEDLDVARKLLALRDAKGQPCVEIIGADHIRKLRWQVSEDAIAMVCWWTTLVPEGFCAEDCGEDKCDHEKLQETVIKRVPQLKLLCGTWGRYERQPGLPDDSGAGRHYRWVENPTPPKRGYVWHRSAVGACAFIDFRGDVQGRPVLVTEGFKKGAVAWALGMPVVVLASVTQGGSGKTERVSDLLAGGHGRYELDIRILDMLDGARGLWAFDADIVTKESVRRSLAGSMVSAKLCVGVEPEFILFPQGDKTKGALDSFLLANKGEDPWDVLRPLVVSLNSLDSCGQWLRSLRGPDVVTVAWEYFRELRARKECAEDAEAALRAWVVKCVDAERARELLLPYDPKSLARNRRDRLQAHLTTKYVLVSLGPEASKVMTREGARLVKPVPNDNPDQAMERTCFRWWTEELGDEPEVVSFSYDVKRFKLRNAAQVVSPISRSDEDGLTRWIMPDAAQGPLPHTERILARLREIDAEGMEVPLTQESRDAALALIGGIFQLQASRQVAVCCGEGGNGKGTLAKLVASAFGGMSGGYSVAYAVGDGTFNSANKHWAVPLVGKYFCAILESKRSRLLEDERLRGLTGGDALPVDEKGGEQYNAPNTTRWWSNTNHMMEITSQRADLSRVFPLQFGDREDKGSITDSGFENGVMAELPHFMWACQEAYKRVCPKGGDVPLTPGLVRVRDQMVAAGEAELEAFASRHLVFQPEAVLKGTDVTDLMQYEAPRSWEKTQKQRFREYLTRRLGKLRNHRIGKDTVYGWKGARLKTGDERMGL
ncbi:DUF5906 domain-containing protein [Myxococcus sp. MxC21-1]|uniref:DUF5906 domain-containing protein n=1 Tax=Myxococcus sp. MxC21-1 TaxID=3041439 RepID=UPI002930F0B9|nr:DUF5906 domain-containing protein [Myxococcus sp. MxC21-1]WNZ59109.1 DUF5906 domain-containing protein [Myxococcus sp. MxC21-1]